MKRHARSIYGCTQAPDEFVPPPDCRYTWNPDTRRLYLHVFSWPYKHLHLPGLADRIEYAQLLHDASEVKLLTSIHEESYGAMKPDRTTPLLTLELPVHHPPATVPVIELFLKR
jgi:alpha-L-fucosidase